MTRPAAFADPGTAAMIGPVPAPGLHVMSFNVRRRMNGLAWRRADRWSHREQRVQALLASERPALLGVQEALPDQAAAIADALGPRYRFIGRGRRSGGRGEGGPLFYDGHRLELLEYTQTALSDRPQHGGSISWGNPLPRMLVAAVFRDRVGSAQLLVMNTHLDPFSARSRLKSVHEIRRRVAALRLPALVTGDLNATRSSTTVRALLADDLLLDTWASAADRVSPEWDTFADYRPPRSRGRRIDWIAATGDIRVERAGVNARRVDGGWPSDHLPVQAVVHLPEDGASP